MSKIATRSHTTDNNITKVKDDEICLVCTTRQTEISYIFEESCDITEKIEYCTGLKTTKDDGLPSYICRNCMQDLATAYKFKSSCLLAYETYQNLLKKSEIKNEIEYDDSECLTDDNDFVWDEVVKEEPVSVEIVVSAEENDLPSKTCKLASKKPRGPYKKKPKDPKARKQKNKKVRHRCASCNINFQTSLLKEEHMKCVHNAEQVAYVCEVCGKVLIKKWEIYAHKLLHIPPRYSCDQCDYKATYNRDLFKHKMVHLGIKQFQCQKCAAPFRTSSCLVSHMRRIHYKNCPKRYKCELCGKGFYDRAKYTRHVDTHTQVKRFQCEICDSAFSRRCFWKKHREDVHNIVTPRQRPGRQKTFEAEEKNKMADT